MLVNVWQKATLLDGIGFVDFSFYVVIQVIISNTKDVFWDSSENIFFIFPYYVPFE